MNSISNSSSRIPKFDDELTIPKSRFNDMAHDVAKTITISPKELPELGRATPQLKKPTHLSKGFSLFVFRELRKNGAPYS